MNTDTITVYILSNNPDSSKTQLIKSLFDNSIFDIKIVDVTVPEGYSMDGLTKSKAQEYYRFNWILKDSKKEGNNHIVIIKDTSVSNTDAGTIAELIKIARDAGNFHICYLAKWLDRCDLYSNKKSIVNKSTIIAKTQSPHGVQALMISPHGQDVLLGNANMNNGQKFKVNESLSESLNDNIVKGNLDATCIVPNLFEFDVTMAKKPEDYAKAQNCKGCSDGNVDITEVNSREVKTRQGAGTSVLAGIGLIVVIIVIIWLIWYFFFRGTQVIVT